MMRSLPNVAPKPRILICAPSNAAADELLQRIMGTGFHDVQVEFLMMLQLSEAVPDCSCRLYTCSQRYARRCLTYERPSSGLRLRRVLMSDLHLTGSYLPRCRGVPTSDSDWLLSEMHLMHPKVRDAVDAS